MDLLIQDLRRIPQYAQTKWNVNGPWEADALNILIPAWSDDDLWVDGTCGGLPRQPAGCVTLPSESYILCNPAIGRELASPLVHSGIASAEEYAGTRFILLAIIGHELAHINLHSDSLKHFSRLRDPDGLACYGRPVNAVPTEEEEADAMGAETACAAAKASVKSWKLELDSQKALRSISNLEDHLDEGYFAMDDLCTGDKNYPSISRRKQRFSNAFLSCFYPNSSEPTGLLERSLTSDLEDLESWLTDRQIRGQVGSGNYGIRPLSANVIADGGAPGTFLSFDGTDTDSALWSVVLDTDNKLKIDILSSWPKSGDVIRVSKMHNSVEWLLQLNRARTGTGPLAIDVSTQCVGRACTSRENKTLILPADSRLVAGQHGSLLLVTRSGFIPYKTSAELFAVTDSRWGFKKHSLGRGADELAAAFSPSWGMIFVKGGDGLYNAALFDKDTVSWRVLVTLPYTNGRLESALMLDDRILLTFVSTPLGGPASYVLWDCPAEEFHHHKGTKIDCTSYTAPAEINTPVAITVRDNSAIEDAKIDAEPVCGAMLAVHHLGWLWLLDRGGASNDVLLANGLLGCAMPERVATTFRARRIDQLKLKLVSVKKGTVSVAVMVASGPPRRAVHRSNHL